MIYQKDWLIRQIERMIAAIAHTLLDYEPPATDTVTTEQQYRAKIAAELKSGSICEAENWLYENIGSDPMWFRLAVFFYGEANQLSDDFLEVNNFSREEIQSGFLDVCKECGYDWVEMFGKQ